MGGGGGSSFIILYNISLYLTRTRKISQKHLTILLFWRVSKCFVKNNKWWLPIIISYFQKYIFISRLCRITENILNFYQSVFPEKTFLNIFAKNVDFGVMTL